MDVFLLALALSMDAFAVSVGLGSQHPAKPHQLAVRAGLYFGVFQGFMPVLGFLAGKGVLGWIDTLAPWIAFFLLLLIGAKMLYEAVAKGEEGDGDDGVDGVDRVKASIKVLTARTMLILAVATSIDALAAGFTLNLLPVNPFMACLLIGITTFLLSVIGVWVGNRTGTWLESKAECLGGIILIAIGFKILLT